jgi:hypothetical protein
MNARLALMKRARLAIEIAGCARKNMHGVTKESVTVIQVYAWSGCAKTCTVAHVNERHGDENRRVCNKCTRHYENSDG